MMPGQGDDSTIPVPAIFMFVPGMPVVAKENTDQGLKLVNGANYTAQHIILDKVRPTDRRRYRAPFWPADGILLRPKTMKLPLHWYDTPSTVLLTPTSVEIEYQRKLQWQQVDISSRGLPCATAFACTGYKVQKRNVRSGGVEATKDQDHQH